MKGLLARIDILEKAYLLAIMCTPQVQMKDPERVSRDL